MEGVFNNPRSWWLIVDPWLLATLQRKNPRHITVQRLEVSKIVAWEIPSRLGDVSPCLLVDRYLEDHPSATCVVGNYMGSKSHIPGVVGPLPNGLNGPKWLINGGDPNYWQVYRLFVNAVFMSPFVSRVLRIGGFFNKNNTAVFGTPGSPKTSFKKLVGGWTNPFEY